VSHAVASGWGAWAALALLGAYHGLNPGMGWLFAVSLGLQERSGAAVARALPPIALGHAVSIGLAVGALAVGRVSLSPLHLRIVTAGLLFSVGLYKLWRHRHPRWVGMRVGFRDLTIWSFLMATAHGAGLMLLPIFLTSGGEAPHCQAHGAPILATWSGYASAVGLHTGAMLVVAAAIALVVYYKVGLALLRRAWFNLDQIWAAGLLVSGGLALWM
jgi:hypothetical protein